MRWPSSRLIIAIDGVGNGYDLVATAPGLAGVTSVMFNVTP